MAAIRPNEIDRFLASGLIAAPLVLVFGPDEGGVRARLAQIEKKVLGPEADAMNRVDLDAETLNDDPVRLLDEANAISMFGGRRLIVVGQAGKLQKGVWQPLLEHPPVDSTVVFLADEMTKSAPLRVALEQARHGAALGCYAPQRQDIVAMIDARAQAAGLAVTPVARAMLADLLGSDHALSESEIEKLVIYCHGKLSIEPADIDALVADSSELSGTEPIDRAFEGKLEEIENVASRSFREGINPSGMLALAINHVIMLKRLAISRSAGRFDQAMKEERLHFRRADRVREQARAWEVPQLARALEILATAQDQARRTAALEETIVIRALWSIALASRRR